VILVTPMTLLRRDYLREIFDGLASHDLEVRHVLVHADPDELARRINHDQGLPEQTRPFASDNRGQPCGRLQSLVEPSRT
jgi:hypothetical protein